MTKEVKERESRNKRGKNDLNSYIGRKIKDFANTPIKNEFVIIFEDNTALWFHEGPYAIGSVRELEKDKKRESKENE